MNSVRCHWSQPWRTGSCAVKRHSLPWLRSGKSQRSALSIRLKWGQMKWDELGDVNAASTCCRGCFMAAEVVSACDRSQWLAELQRSLYRAGGRWECPLIARGSLHVSTRPIHSLVDSKTLSSTERHRYLVVDRIGCFVSTRTVVSYPRAVLRLTWDDVDGARKDDSIDGGGGRYSGSADCSSCWGAVVSTVVGHQKHAHHHHHAALLPAASRLISYTGTTAAQHSFTPDHNTARLHRRWRAMTSRGYLWSRYDLHVVGNRGRMGISGKSVKSCAGMIVNLLRKRSVLPQHHGGERARNEKEVTVM